MKKLERLLLLCGFFSITFVFFPKYIFAYIDPGTGSYVIQLLIAFFIGVSFAIKLSWKKIKTFFSILFKKKSK